MSAKKAAKAAPEPDDLSRESAGTYRSGDNRFEVRQSGGTWYLVDLERTNDFGQELIHGPFATLKEAREAIPGARKVTPLPRPSLAAAAKRAAAKKPAEPPPPPPSWIDQLPAAEATEVRRLSGAQEREGLGDAEELVRSARKAGGPSLASRVIERRLEALVEEAEPDERRRTRELVRRVVNILTEDGTATASPLPRWELVQTDPGQPQPLRRLRLKI
jgi:hypothetical protein